MKRQRPRSSLDINSPRGCIRIGFARIPRPSRPGRYGNLNRLPIIRRKHIDYLLLRIIHHLIDVTAYIGCIDIDVIRDLRNRCLTCKTCQYQTCKDTWGTPARPSATLKTCFAVFRRIPLIHIKLCKAVHTHIISATLSRMPSAQGGQVAR